RVATECTLLTDPPPIVLSSRCIRRHFRYCIVLIFCLGVSSCKKRRSEQAFIFCFSQPGSPVFVLLVRMDCYTANNNRRNAGEGACGWWSPSGFVCAVESVSLL